MVRLSDFAVFVVIVFLHYGTYQRMATRLPLVIRQKIRDDYDADTSEVNKKLKALENELGCNASVKIDWNPLWTASKHNFNDPDQFVPTVSEWIESLITSVNHLISKEQEWGEKLAEQVMDEKGGRGLQIRVLIAKLRGSSLTRIDWREAENEIAMELSESIGPHSRPRDQYFFARQLLDMFSPQPKQRPVSMSKVSTIPSRDTGPAVSPEEEDEDWESLGGSKPSRGKGLAIFSQSALSQQPVPAHPTPFPSLASLGRPENLMEECLPYIMRVESSLQGRPEHPGDPVSILCTHERTLRLLHDYFIANNRFSGSDNYEYAQVKIKLKKSTFGTGGPFDRLDMFVNMQRHSNATAHLNPLMVVAIARDRLGFQQVYTNGRVWILERAVPFS